MCSSNIDKQYIIVITPYNKYIPNSIMCIKILYAKSPEGKDDRIPFLVFQFLDFTFHNTGIMTKNIKAFGQIPTNLPLIPLGNIKNQTS